MGKLVTGIIVSFIGAYGDEVLQSLLFASKTNNSKALSH
jgi:ABC-type maltose transport system permease subunit